MHHIFVSPAFHNEVERSDVCWYGDIGVVGIEHRAVAIGYGIGRHGVALAASTE